MGAEISIVTLDALAPDERERFAEEFELLAEDDAMLCVDDVCGFVLVLSVVKPLPPFVEPPPPPPPHALKSDMASNAKIVEIFGRGKPVIKTTYCMVLHLDQIGLRESASI